MSANLFQRWLEIASEDLIVARLVAEEEHFSHACFLSQQCIEKTLKAYLVAQTGDYPRIHKLVDLLGQCTLIAPDFAQFAIACASVDQYYIPTRYPKASLEAGQMARQASAKPKLRFAGRQEILDNVTVRLRQVGEPGERG
jgi:HEPN domain-containing protein